MAERLYRSRSKKVIGGVAGGLADYLNIDPVLIRVLFVIITLINGFGLLLYIILWIVVQEEPYKNFAYEMGSDEHKTTHESEPQVNQPNQMKKTESKGAVVVGVVLIALGFIFLADNWFPSFHFRDVFPLAILGVGIWLVVDSLNKRETRNENR